MRISTSFLILQMVLLYVIIGNVSAQNINGKYYHDSLLLYSPSYEHYSFLANYKLNQLINEVLDVTSIGSISGTILGLLSGLPSYIKRKDEIKSGLYLMIPSLIGLIAGTSTGFVIGIPYGYIKGKKLEELKKENPDFHKNIERWGYEVTFLRSFTIKEENGYFGTMYNPGGYISYRLLNKKIFLPDQILLGWIPIRIFKFTKLSARENRVLFNSIFHLIEHNFFKPYFGYTLGWSFGKINELAELNYKSKHYNSPFIDLNTGFKLNCFDFFYVRLGITYEFIGSYFILKRHGSISYATNFRFLFSAGMYVF